MSKVGLPPGLIRYATEHALARRWSSREIAARVFRPRVLVYTGLLALIIVAFVASLAVRTPLKMDVIRDRGAMGREVEDGMIENVYRLQIMNTSETAHTFRIGVSGIQSIRLETPPEVSMEGATTRAVPVRVRIDHATGKTGSNPITFELKALDDAGLAVSEAAVFIVPR